VGVAVVIMESVSNNVFDEQRGKEGRSLHIIM